MKVGILAGGMGTRLAEETARRPKPMVEVGGRPILWHIMKHYGQYNFSSFAIALGYRGDCIKRYLANKCAQNTMFDRRTCIAAKRHGNRTAATEEWVIDLVETGLTTNTGGRIKRLAPYLGTGTFMLTWGDGVSNVDLNKLVMFHRSHGKLATVTAVRPPSRFGRLTLDGQRVTNFREKPQGEDGWINGAFFVLEPGVFDYIDGDETQWEKEPLETLAAEGELMAYQHEGFWQCLDTIHDKRLLEEHWQSGHAPWKTWS